MATTVNPTTTMPSLTDEITEALAEPMETINRLALYDSAEAKKRHTQAGMSILRYALERYITSSIDVPTKYEVKVEATDESVIVTGKNRSPRQAKKDSFEQEIAYPLWLTSFFEDDEMFALLTPGNTTSLAEVIDAMTTHVETLDDETNEDDDEYEADEEDEEDDDEEAEDDEDPEEDDDEAGVDEAEDDEGDDEEDEDEDDTEDDEPVMVTSNCRPNEYGECTNTIHHLGGDHDGR